jgi:hypothetical protein
LILKKILKFSPSHFLTGKKKLGCLTGIYLECIQHWCEEQRHRINHKEMLGNKKAIADFDYDNDIQL